MLSIAKKTFIMMLFLTAFSTSIWAMNSSAAGVDNARLERFEPADDYRLISSRFTQPDDLREVALEHFIPRLESDEKVLENNTFILYMNQETLAFKIEDKRTGYIWNTIIDDVDAGTFNPLLSSSIGFEYININQNYSLRQNVGIIDTEFDVEMRILNDTITMNITIGGFCTSRQCSRFYEEYVAGNPAYDLERMITLGFVNLDISFQLQLTLTDTGLKVHVPFESIEEGNQDNIVLSSLMIFPGLGAAFKDDIPGYMVIPDGAGALIRYNDNQGRFIAPYEERFYGRNLGIVTGRSSVTNYPLTLPIFGAVHGVFQNAFVGIIESGDLNATLLAYPSGASNIPYHLIYPRFDFKQTYRQSFTSDGLGGSLKIHESAQTDITLRYDFLAGNEAHYVGIGLRYQEVLNTSGVLQASALQNNNIPIHLQFLMADSKDRFIGKDVIVMTDLEAAVLMHETLKNQGLAHQRISLMGWNSGGYSGQLPASFNVESRLGTRRDIRQLDTLFDTSYPLLLVNNYTFASEATDRINYRRDVALGVNRFRLQRECSNCVYTWTYFITPERSRTLALRDQNAFASAGVGLLFEDLGNTLFSYDFNGSKTRAEMIETYQDIFSAYEGMSGYQYPFPYVWPYTDTFFEAPLYHSQLKYFDDLIPLLSIVLSGQMEMHSTFLNFNSLGRSQLLRLIDFNVYPSYILTDERPSMLRGSDLESMFATEFSLFENVIVEEYEMINRALSQVIGARIIARDVIDHGIVRVTYDNGVSIWINYSFQDFNASVGRIQAQDILIEGGRP